MDEHDELEILGKILATMRDRMAAGDARARVVAGVIEAMMAEREQAVADEHDAAEADPRSQPL